MSEHVALAVTQMELHESLQKAYEDLRETQQAVMPQERGVVIDVQLDLQDNLPAVMGVESEIRGALTNLVFNAVDAMAEGGCLTMRTRAEGPSVLLEVTDTGVGMDEEMKRRCIDPFYSTKGERGTGLGLAMVYGVVQRHEAEITIESRPGKGTSMRLVFPVTSGAGVASPAAVAFPRAAGPLYILCIDDDPLMRQSVQETLEREGHRVHAAEAGEAGLDAFRAAAARGEPFDIVITDLGMPHMDGREVARSIKRDSPTTPVVLLTGWGMHMNAEGDKPAHVDRVISKPPKLKDLRALCCPR